MLGWAWGWGVVHLHLENSGVSYTQSGVHQEEEGPPLRAHGADRLSGSAPGSHSFPTTTVGLLRPRFACPPTAPDSSTAPARLPGTPGLGGVVSEHVPASRTRL